MFLRVIVIVSCAVVSFSLRADTNVGSPLPALTATSVPSTGPQNNSPNQALADMAKDVLLKSIKPEYEKQENWGHQKEMVDGYRWVQHPDGWHLEKQTRKVNDGLWREYKVRFDNPQKNLQLQFTQPRPVDGGRTAFQAILVAKLGIEARQEQWLLGVKGFNFQLEGEAKVEAKLDIVIGIQPAPSGGFGSIEVQPEVTHVGLRLVDLALKRVDLIHGDAARELGHALEDILAGELRKQEPKVTSKINAEIQKHRDKLQFSPSQIAEIGWEKVQSLVGAANAASPPTK